MRYLILSDIHANADALQAVETATAGKYDRVVCLGDLVGYGAEPNQVIDWMRERATVVIRGNHDRIAAGLDDVTLLNESARAAILWTQKALTPENRDYLASLPPGPQTIDGDFQIVHGSPADEDEYLFLTSQFARVFPRLETTVSFFGHTHVQGGFLGRRSLQVEVPLETQEPGHLTAQHRGFSGIFEVDRMPLNRTEAEFRLITGAFHLLNPGAVGQPRDRNVRAGYCLYDSERQVVLYGRAAYDVASAQAKILKAGLPERQAERLAVGA